MRGLSLRGVGGSVGHCQQGDVGGGGAGKNWDVCSEETDESMYALGYLDSDRFLNKQEEVHSLRIDYVQYNLDNFC